MFSPVKATKKGWDVCCPAHEDHHPSLGIKEGEQGRIVLHCLAGCANLDILHALGLTWLDLFPENEQEGPRKALRLPPVPKTPHERAFAWELQAHDLREAARKIFESAKRCEDVETWTNDDLDLAMTAVARGYAYQERATWCESYADHIRGVW